jgi:hypothetical protein
MMSKSTILPRYRTYPPRLRSSGMNEERGYAGVFRQARCVSGEAEGFRIGWTGVDWPYDGDYPQ